MSEIKKLKEAIATAPKVPLGDLIEPVDNRNYDGNYSVEHLQGVTSEGVFDYSKAKTDGIDFTKYKIVKEGCFAYNPSRINLGSIALRKGEDCIISPMYIVFKINTKGQNELMPEFLYLWFMRPEFQRSTLFYASGSVRDTFGYNEMCRVLIPLPPIEVQQQYVNAYSGLRKLAEENEALLDPLSKACQAYLAEVNSQYSQVRLGDYIDEFVKINADNSIKDVRGVSVSKHFVLTNAKVDKSDLSKYKIVPPLHIAYVQTTKNEKCFAFAINTSNSPVVVSSVDRVIFSSKPDMLSIEFLALWFMREEWDRYAIFNSWGSAREVFSYEDLCNSTIPLPPIEVQQSIVALHRCAEEARSIAAKARETLSTICPAMIQRASHKVD